MGEGTLPVRQRSTSSAARAASASASAMPASRSFSGPTRTRARCETHDGEPRWTRVRRRPLRPGRADRPPRGLGDHGRRPRRGRAAVPAVLASGPFDDPQPRRYGSAQRRGSARGALAGLHGRGRAPAAARRAGRERPRPPELGRRRGPDGLLRVAPGPRVRRRCTRSRRASSTACRSTGRACSSSACGTGARSSGPSPRRTITTLRDAIGDLPPVPPAQRDGAHPVLRGPAYAVPAADARRGTRARPSRASTTTSRATSAPTTPRRSRCSARGRPTWICPSTCGATAATSSPTSTSGSLGRGQPEHHRPHRQGRLLVHPSPAAPDALGPRGRPGPDLPRLVPLRRPADPQAEADRQRRPAAAGRGARSADAGRARCDAARRRRGAASDFRTLLLAWHARPSRDYPWRAGAASPWLVLLAELCLSRTRADLVPVIFERLCALAPSPARAARTRRPGSRRSRRSAWACERRSSVDVARGARRATSTARSRRPSSSCARSRASATTSPRPFVLRLRPARGAARHHDTARLVERYLGRSDTRRWQLRLDLYRLAGAPGPDAAFNHALLDLGALVCRAEHAAVRRVPASRAMRRRGAVSPSRSQLTLPQE